MGIFLKIRYLFEDINQANREFVSGVREIVTETKTGVIKEIKDHHPKVGKTIENLDLLIITARNGYERLPDTTGGPFNPQIQMKKLFKEMKKNTNIKNVEEFGRAKHLKVNRPFYSHHALSLGDGQVIHYSEGIVHIQTIEEFAKGAIIFKVDTHRTRNKDEVIQRAYSRLGENRYNLIFNNCEHFVRWCMNGED
ncbi:MAG TPA: lecithin retinol acyltransferase family protein [Ureibacillus sp.]|nr:lecithin retinol acyltransferase family protein [Ureibacillus sp.]